MALVQVGVQRKLCAGGVKRSLEEEDRAVSRSRPSALDHGEGEAMARWTWASWPCIWQTRVHFGAIWGFQARDGWVGTSPGEHVSDLQFGNATLLLIRIERT